MDRAKLLRRIDEGWRAFRAKVGHIGRARLERPPSAGWTFKDLVGHVAAWEEEVPRQLAALREGTYRWSLSVDEFNRRAVEERRLVGAEAILDELDAAHRRLVQAVREMPEEQLADKRALEWIVESTYAHYAEHVSELGGSPAA